MKTLRQTHRGQEVIQWQHFLIGQGQLLGAADGIFGPITAHATREFQRLQGLTIDGIVGPNTYGRAMLLGFDPVTPDTSDKSQRGPNWPPSRASFTAPSQKLREKLFGKFDYTHAPTATSPERIRINGSWQKENIVRVSVPQLRGVLGANRSGTIFFHRSGAEALQQTFQAWEDEGLIHQVRAWAGSFVPRFIRGSRSVLSNHAFGTAFDINAAWNPLGARPALVGKAGSVRELVPIAMDHGFAWGGHYRNRPDGMHFELVRPDPV